MKIITKNHLAIGLLISSWAGGASLTAAPQTFDFKDPKGVNTVRFDLDAPLEAISGTAKGVSGTVTYDPAQPASLRGKIVVEAASLHVGNPTMKEHLHGENWMDVANHPEISFEATGVDGIKKLADDDVEARVLGKFTMKGTTREMTVPVRLTYLKGRLQERSRVEGDLLVLRAKFTLSRKDFGIMPGRNEDKVADEIELAMSIAGSCPK